MITIPMILVTAAAVGIGCAGASIVWLAVRPRYSRLMEVLDADQRRSGHGSPEREERRNRKLAVDAYWAIGGTLVGMMVVPAPRWLPAAMIIGAGLGYLARRGVAWAKKRTTRWKRLQQTAVLYEAVDLYSQMGYPVYDALQASALLLPDLRDSVQRCLRRWGQGPVRALQILGEEIDIAEAEILIAVLQHGVTVGQGHIGGIMADEARQLEALRQRVMEEQMSMRPLYLTLYTGLPGLALMGIIFTPFALKVSQMLEGMI